MEGRLGLLLWEALVRSHPPGTGQLEPSSVECCDGQAGFSSAQCASVSVRSICGLPRLLAQRVLGRTDLQSRKDTRLRIVVTGVEVGKLILQIALG